MSAVLTSASLLSRFGPPAWGPTGQEVYERTYSRDLPDGSKETWEDTVHRVVRGNAALVDERFIQPGEVERLEELLYQFKVIPAGRHLWVSGVPGRQFNRNCHLSGWGPNLSDHFTFTFNELMKGGGVGANYSSEILLALPKVENWTQVYFMIDSSHPDAAEVEATVGEHFIVQGPGDAEHWEVPDTREGWVEAMGRLIDGSTEGGENAIVFDLSRVRARGSKINGFGGVASGPGPLGHALVAAAEVLNAAFDRGGRLSPLRAMELDHAIAQCVVAGNVRRSARMAILHWKDEFIFDFIDCKSDPEKHWTTNISVEVDDEFFAELAGGGSHAVEVFRRVTEGMFRNGEPGFFNSSLASIGERNYIRATNPCGEIALESWESCNLGHVNLAQYANDFHGAIEAFELMARFLLRATFADLTDPRQAEVEARNRRIGVGFFGFQEWLGVEFNTLFSESPGNADVRRSLREFKAAVVRAADRYADELGIPRPVKHTTLAPTGSIAKLPGTTEGIHPVYSRYYERRIRYAENNPKLAELAVDHTIEDCLYSANTKVVVFHVKDSILDRLDDEVVEQANEIDIDEMLAVQRMVQEEYANNAVSFTANIDRHTSLDELRAALMTHLPHLKGTTVMPDESRPQAPYTRITREVYEQATDHEVGQAFDECASGACPIR